MLRLVIIKMQNGLKDAWSYRITCTTMFLTSQFSIAKIWNQPKCWSTDEWVYIKKYCLTIRITLYFCNKINAIEAIILSNINHYHKNTYHLFFLPWNNQYADNLKSHIDKQNWHFEIWLSFTSIFCILQWYGFLFYSLIAKFFI